MNDTFKATMRNNCNRSENSARHGGAETTEAISAATTSKKASLSDGGSKDELAEEFLDAKETLEPPREDDDRDGRGGQARREEDDAAAPATAERQRQRPPSHSVAKSLILSKYARSGKVPRLLKSRKAGFEHSVGKSGDSEEALSGQPAAHAAAATPVPSNPRQEGASPTTAAPSPAMPRGVFLSLNNSMSDTPLHHQKQQAAPTGGPPDLGKENEAKRGDDGGDATAAALTSPTGVDEINQQGIDPWLRKDKVKFLSQARNRQPPSKAAIDGKAANQAVVAVGYNNTPGHNTFTPRASNQSMLYDDDNDETTRLADDTISYRGNDDTLTTLGDTTALIEEYEDLPLCDRYKLEGKSCPAFFLEELSGTYKDFTDALHQVRHAFVISDVDIDRMADTILDARDELRERHHARLNERRKGGFADGGADRGTDAGAAVGRPPRGTTTAAAAARDPVGRGPPRAAVRRTAGSGPQGERATAAVRRPAGREAKGGGPKGAGPKPTAGRGPGRTKADREAKGGGPSGATSSKTRQATRGPGNVPDPPQAQARRATVALSNAQTKFGIVV